MSKRQAVPIYNTDIKMQLIEMFITMLSDNVKAREEDYNGNYKIPKNQDTPLNSQEFFYKQAYLNAENEMCIRDRNRRCKKRRKKKRNYCDAVSRRSRI